MAIGADFSIDFINRRITHDSGTTTYTVLELYSHLQGEFDELTALDDPVPMTAQTPTEFTLVNSWFIDDESMHFLSGGAIRADASWNAAADDNGIRLITAAQATYTDAVGLDLGKNVAQATTGDTGVLLAFDNVRRRWWVRVDATGDTFNSTTDAITVTSGTGVATADRTPTTGGATLGSLWSNVFTLGTIETSPSAQIYIRQGSDGVIDEWWARGQIDVLIKVSEMGVSMPVYAEADAAIEVFSRQYLDAFDNFPISVVAGGRNAVPLATANDLNNTSAEFFALYDNETVANFSVGEVVAREAQIVSSQTGAFTVSGADDTLSLAVDGGSPQTVTLTSGSRTAAQVATEIAALTGIASSASGSQQVIIASETTGFGSSIEILPVDTDAYDLLGLNVTKPGQLTCTVASTHAIVDGVNDTLLIAVGEVYPQSVDLTAGGARTSLQIADDINNQTVGLVASVSSSRVLLTADRADTEISMVSVAVDAYEAMGFQVGSTKGAEFEVTTLTDSGTTGVLGLGGVSGLLVDNDAVTGGTSGAKAILNGGLGHVVLNYDGGVGTFLLGDTITETGTTYTASLVGLEDGGATGVMTVREPTGLFLDDGALTGTGGATAVVEGTLLSLGIAGLEFFNHVDNPDALEVWWVNANVQYDTEANGPFTVGGVIGRPGEVTSATAGDYTIGAGSTDKLNIGVDGGAPVDITLTAGTRTAIQVAATIAAAVTGLSASGASGSVVLTSDTDGALSEVEIATSLTNGAEAVLGFTIGRYQGAEGVLVELLDSGTTGTLTLANVRGTFVDNAAISQIGGSQTAIVNNADGSDVQLTTQQAFDTQTGFPYNVVIECSNRTLALMYEYASKYYMRADSQSPTYEFTRRRVLEYAAAGYVNFVANDLGLTLTGGTSTDTGKVIDFDNSTRKVTVLMTNSTSLFDVAEATSGTTGDGTTVGASYRDPNAGENYQIANENYAPVKAAPLGSFAGGIFFGARGVWVQNMVAADATNVQLIDANSAQRLPPDFQIISVISLVSLDRVAVFRTTGANSIVDKLSFNVDATAGSGLSAFDTTEAITDDYPTSGVVRLVKRDAVGDIVSEHRATFDSWVSGTPSTITLSGTLASFGLASGLTDLDTCYIPFIDEQASGTSVSVTVVYVANVNVVGRVRKYAGSGASILPFETVAVFGATGLTVNATRTNDGIVT